MDILFVHKNYPAQFQFLAAYFARKKANTIFLTNRSDYDAWPIEGVKVIRYTLDEKSNAKSHPIASSYVDAALSGLSVARHAQQLKKNGFYPKLIFVHGGNGLSLFLKEIFPDSILLTYMEWWFAGENIKHLVRRPLLKHRCLSIVRNSVILDELYLADHIVTPTQWQASQFPVEFSSKIKILFDGVDTNFFKPMSISSSCTFSSSEYYPDFQVEIDQQVITYATRGMEPLRGFPEFMLSLPSLLNSFPRLVVLIAGMDRVAYSYPSPSESGLWKDYMLSQIQNQCDCSRIFFLGSISLSDYRMLLCRSDLHVYFSRPYVTSWGLFQAAACGTPLLVNNSPAINYVLTSDCATFVDLDNPEEIVSASSRLLQADSSRQIRKSFLAAEFSLNVCLKEWLRFLSSL